MKILCLLIGAILSIHLHAQQKEFEGTIVYKVTVKSKVKEISDDYFKFMLAMNGNKLTIDIKDGNYKRSLGFAEEFYIPKDKKAYVKFKKIDTLFYRDYLSDTSKNIDIKKTDSLTQINGFACKSILIRTNLYTSLFRYTNSLFIDPRHDTDNTIGNINLLVKETGGGVWLYSRVDYQNATLTDSCVEVQQKNIEPHIFDLPKLPMQDLLRSTLFVPSRFPGKENSWALYLNNSLNPDIAAKYVKLSKGKDTASQTVMVTFVVNEDGIISNIDVENKNEINSKLVQEAMRVIRESPRWIAATVYGEKIKMHTRQPIVFAVKKG